MSVFLPRNYLNPKSRQNNNTKPLKMAQKAFILHTFGVQAHESFALKYLGADYSLMGPWALRTPKTVRILGGGFAVSDVRFRVWGFGFKAYSSGFRI